MRRRRAMLALLGSAGGLLACGPPVQLKPAFFVGRWKSSRLTSPLLLKSNGEWEIRSADDNALLQAGTWRLDGQTLEWIFREAAGPETRDRTLVLLMEPERFQLREQDGSTTTFVRWKA